MGGSGAHSGEPMASYEGQTFLTTQPQYSLTDIKRVLAFFASNHRPPIMQRRVQGELEALQQQYNLRVEDWPGIKRNRGTQPKPVPKEHKKSQGVSKAVARSNPKVGAGGRTYTSKYRGVHQTFPTKRWEAQFRRSGKPTSLGCFDEEEQAARAYDKMMLWCELHDKAGAKSGITNFDAQDYQADLPLLRACTQDELIEMLRSDGRKQAAHRMLRAKREGQSSDTEPTH